MSRTKIIIGLLIAGVFLFTTAAAVNGAITDEVPIDPDDRVCDGTGPHGLANGHHGQGTGTSPQDGTGNKWGSQGPHGDGSCNQTAMMPA